MSDVSDETGGVWALVLAAGTGNRFGREKQFALLGGRRLIDRAVEAAAAACDRVVAVVPPGASWDGQAVAAAVAGGATRAQSVRAGLRAIPASAEVIVVHDAAHPLATPGLFAAVIDTVRAGADAGLPALPPSEVIKRVRDGQVRRTVGRDGLALGQMPQAFRAAALRAVHVSEPSAVEDTELIEAAGGAVAVVPGDPRNLHVTTPADLQMAARLL